MLATNRLKAPFEKVKENLLATKRIYETEAILVFLLRNRIHTLPFHLRNLIHIPPNLFGWHLFQNSNIHKRLQTFFNNLFHGHGVCS